jgi:hypothetical protein
MYTFRGMMDLVWEVTLFDLAIRQVGVMFLLSCSCWGSCRGKWSGGNDDGGCSHLLASLLIFFFIGEVVLLNQQHPLLRFFFMKLFLWRKLELILANKLVSTIFSLLIGALCDKVVDITAIIEQPFGLEPLKLSLDLLSHVISLNLMKPLNGTYPQQHPAFCTSWVKPSG